MNQDLLNSLTYGPGQRRQKRPTQVQRWEQALGVKLRPAKAERIEPLAVVFKGLTLFVAGMLVCLIIGLICR